MTQVLCSEAGGDCKGKIHQHHDDYSKPKVTRPLCSRHHQLWHAKHRAKDWESGPEVSVTAKLPPEAAEAFRSLAKSDGRQMGNLLKILILFLLETPTLQTCLLTQYGWFEADPVADAKQRARIVERQAQAKLIVAARAYFEALKAAA